MLQYLSSYQRSAFLKSDISWSGIFIRNILGILYKVGYAQQAPFFQNIHHPFSYPATVDSKYFKPDICSSKIIWNTPRIVFNWEHLRLQFVYSGISAASSTFLQYPSSYPDCEQSEIVRPDISKIIWNTYIHT